MVQGKRMRRVDKALMPIVFALLRSYQDLLACSVVQQMFYLARSGTRASL